MVHSNPVLKVGHGKQRGTSRRSAYVPVKESAHSGEHHIWKTIEKLFGKASFPDRTGRCVTCRLAAPVRQRHALSCKMIFEGN